LSINPQDNASDEADDIVLHGLESLNWSSAGILDVEEEATTTVTPLILTSDQSKPQAAELLTQMQDPQMLMDDFAPTGDRYTLAARVSGAAKTAFPDGITITVEAEGDTDDAAEADAGDVESEDDAAKAEIQKIINQPEHLERIYTSLLWLIPMYCRIGYGCKCKTSSVSKSPRHGPTTVASL